MCTDITNTHTCIEQRLNLPNNIKFNLNYFLNFLIYNFFASDWQIGDSGDEGGETITHSGIFYLQKTVCREGIGIN